MSSAGGLTRRRGARGGDDSVDNSRVASPSGLPNGAGAEISGGGRQPETSWTDSENGHKIAYDPRDISENEERSRLPKLTLMEEVLLLGLKDKQVRQLHQLHQLNGWTRCSMSTALHYAQLKI